MINIKSYNLDWSFSNLSHFLFVLKINKIELNLEGIL